MNALELLQEVEIVLGEETQVFDAILEVGDTLDTHSQRIAAVHLAVYAAIVEYVRVHHAATEDFHPARMLAEVAAFAAADVARDVHLGRRFGKGEVGRAQTYLGIGAKHLLREVEQYLSEVGKRNILVHIERLHLMEEAVGTIGDGLVAIGAPRADHANGGLRLLHHPALHTGGMRTEDYIGAVLDEEGVLHIARRMVLGEVHR